MNAVNSSFGYLSDLNPPQREAVLHERGPLLVLAGAGSGKTRVLTRRIVHLVQQVGVHPSRILAVTFTNKAADEMRHRMEQMLGPTAKDVWMATFHSAALRILRRHAPAIGFTHDFIVYDDKDCLTLVKQIVKELKIDPKEHPPEAFLRRIDQAKNHLQGPTELPAGQNRLFDLHLVEVYDHYQRALAGYDAMDFGDLLMKAVELLQGNREILGYYQERLEHLLVDEFQDTNIVQYRLLRLLAAKHKNLFVVGDDDQSIYSFRGAHVANILHFEKDFPGTRVVKLEQNYRSQGNILEAAHAVIKQNNMRHAKKLWTDAAKGEPLRAIQAGNEEAEAHYVIEEIEKLRANGVQLKHIALFYRTNAQSRAFEEALVQRNIPYRIFGGLKFYERKEIKDVISYLRLLVNPRDDQAFLRVVNTPPRGVGAQAVQKLLDEAAASKTSLLEAAETVKGHKGIREFLDLLEHLRGMVEKEPVDLVIGELLVRSKYRERLESAHDVSARSRIENLRELEAVARGLAELAETPREGLVFFLDRATLTASSDQAANESMTPGESRKTSSDSVSLMTLHLAKGLEYPVVFLTGLEEGLLPHYQALKDADVGESLQEERRLCYVGITRAMTRLYLSYALQRGMFSARGATLWNNGPRKRSRFFDEIPPDILEFSVFDERESFFLDDEYQEQPRSPLRMVRPGRREPVVRHWNNDDEDTGSTVLAVRKARSFPLGIQSADTLLQRAEGDRIAGDRPSFDADELAIGLDVTHPRFGHGTVIDIQGDPSQEPLTARVSVAFSTGGTKKLIFGKSQLRKG